MLLTPADPRNPKPHPLVAQILSGALPDFVVAYDIETWSAHDCALDASTRPTIAVLCILHAHSLKPLAELFMSDPYFQSRDRAGRGAACSFTAPCPSAFGDRSSPG